MTSSTVYSKLRRLLCLAIVVFVITAISVAFITSCSEPTEAEKAAEARRIEQIARIKEQLPGVTRGDLIQIGNFKEDSKYHIYARVLNRMDGGTRVRYLETGEANVLNDELAAPTMVRIIPVDDPAWCGVIRHLYTQ